VIPFGPRDRAGRRLATEHLLELGDRRIACVRTPLVEPSGDTARYSGYPAAIRAAGVTALPALTWTTGSGVVVVGGQAAPLADAVCAPGTPTAVFVPNDIGAVALIDAREAAGMRVPDHLSVVGFDDIALAGLGRISLTTVAQPLDRPVASGYDGWAIGATNRARHAWRSWVSS
jgi:DNA-binding LacI/PurR family transcriptional regulator